MRNGEKFGSLSVLNRNEKTSEDSGVNVGGMVGKIADDTNIGDIVDIKEGHS